MAIRDLTRQVVSRAVKVAHLARIVEYTPIFYCGSLVNPTPRANK